MKKIKTISVVTILLWAFTGCSDFPDEWGFVVSNDGVKSEMLNASASGYDAKVTANIIVKEEGEGINSVGFIVTTDGDTEHIETIPANFSPNNGCIEISHIFNGLKFNKNYDVQPYIESNHVQYVMSGVQLKRTSQGLQPNITSRSVSMTKDYKIRLRLQGVNTYTTAIAEFGGVRVQGQVSGGGLEKHTECEFLIPLSDLPVGTHDGIRLTISNDFGSVMETIPYVIRVSTATKYNASDGEKGDCITLAGVDWAKGNLVYDNGRWLISDHPLTPSSNPASSSCSEYFTWYSVENSSSFNVRLGSDVFGGSLTNYYGDVQGDVQHDIVAAHLSGWQMPSKSDFEAIVYSSTYDNSVQWCSGGVLFFPVMSGRRYYSGTPINLEERPNGGLYFSAALQYDGNVVKRGQYMMSEGIMQSFYSNNSSWFLGYPDTFCFNTNESSMWCNVRSKQEYSCPTTRYKLPVRPVKKK